jgi:hypothetical protein
VCPMLGTLGYSADARLKIADTICQMSSPNLTDLELETAARAYRGLAHRGRKSAEQSATLLCKGLVKEERAGVLRC